MHSHFSGSERNGNLTPTDETHLYKSVCPFVRPSVSQSVSQSVCPSVCPWVCASVGPSVRWSVGQSVRRSMAWVRWSVTRFCNEPIMDENGRKWRGKPSKWSKLVKKSSELSQNVPSCPKMPTSDASLSEQTCFIYTWQNRNWELVIGQLALGFELR